jgi:malonate transporter
MWDTFNIILPVFGVILLGYLVGKTPLLGEGGVKALTNFVLYIAMPLFLFRAMATLELPGGEALLFIVAYFCAALTNLALGLFLGLVVFRHRLEESAFLGMSFAFSNLALLGIPLVFQAFGERGLLPILMIISAHPLILIAVPTILIEISRGTGDRWYTILGSTGLSLLKNPVILAMLAGLTYGATGLPIPDLADKFIKFVGQAGPPTALFSVGASLAAYKIAGDLREVSVSVTMKLMLLPLLVFTSTHLIFDLPLLWVAVATVASSMPVGVNVFILANYYESYQARAASGVLISTAIAWITVAVVITLVLPLAPALK